MSESGAIIGEIQDLWCKLWMKWREAAISNPLLSVPGDIHLLEQKFIEAVVILLASQDAELQEKLFQTARRIRNSVAGRKIITRASIDLSNVCGVDCGFCPMRASGNRGGAPVKRLTCEEIEGAAQAAYQLGFREFFLQSGEDHHSGFLEDVRMSVSAIKRAYPDSRIILNLGNLPKRQHYLAFKVVGADGYVIKVETSDPTLHRGIRNQPLNVRIAHTLFAREAGLSIGSGVILGLPYQTDRSLAVDLIHLGRLGGTAMVSCSPFTPGPSLAEGFSNHPAADITKTRVFIALLRICFPGARIPATSNLDSESMVQLRTGEMSGQALAIAAGANGLSVKFTPEDMERVYAIYDAASRRKIIKIADAFRVSDEVGLPLDLIQDLSVEEAKKD